MPIKDVFKVSRKTFFSPSAWLGVTQVKSSSRTIWDILRSLFIPVTSQRKETFEMAMKRFNLTQASLASTSQSYFLYALIFLFLAVFSFLFSFYLLMFHKTLAGFLLGLACAALFLSQAFRYHFWYFQIKHRKLGCTFDEWWKGSVNPGRDGDS
jgi:intracellular multiplication protein IcmV